MAIPSRHASPEAIQYDRRTFFLTTSCDGHRRLLQSDRTARLLIDTLFRYRDQHRYELHEFVVMPDHLHVLLTIAADMTIERAAQFIKGGFSYRVSHELGINGAIWQRGFSDERVLTAEQYWNCVNYIHRNPVRVGLAPSPAEYSYGSAAASVGLDAPPWPAAKAAALTQSGRHG